MKYIWQFGIIMLVSFIGELLNRFIPLPIPASIWGIGIMTALLTMGILKLNQVQQTAQFLINIMAITFIPYAVGLVDLWDRIQPIIVPTTIIIITTTVLVFAVSGKIVDFILGDSKNHE